ncbi:MAG: NAD-glutamate dehydrogenase [Pseudomonadota bacterium]
MGQAWNDELKTRLVTNFGDKLALKLFETYENAFSTSYREECSPETAFHDVKHIRKLSPEQPLDIDFYVVDKNDIHLRLYQYRRPIPLSDVLPMLENLDLRTFDERPYKITTKEATIWISDFSVQFEKSAAMDIKKVKLIFQDAFISTEQGLSENDGFNKLVLGAQLSWRDIIILRAYAKYLRQAGFRSSQPYIEAALVNNPAITTDLIALFFARFDPTHKNKDKDIEEITARILQALESVVSLEEDRIIRRLLDLIQATLRTNYFQTDENGNPKEYLSFKLDSHAVPELPLPVPMFEIFVYSPRFEGIHLRNAKVARGGIRWSDRREDFRTEVLGLMKAQKVKNAVIVPSGAKGGFVLKAVPPNATRDVLQAEVMTCYKSFIRGLLDLTDNLKKGKVIKPKNVVCYDEDDTYLVVAADKGTATFSDTANSISKEYDFWLGDAFASGGSAGYDHKKMGITARGAWESVKRHFHELDVNIHDTDFTVVGIGDMSGDVFGNGMIYTPHIKLLAAFDHRDIFLDPDPDPKASFQERVRMFNLPTSSWQDYNPKLISKGGGVYKRSSKSIPISPEVKKALGITENSLVPNELVRAILKAPVDLLWNGGIGTYVKSSTESHADVGDKTNEYCRINGNELRTRVVGEGGNLGLTQLGRVEYALQGGLINTDFIDNSAGVDCSDHEVNLKILLNQEVDKGNLTEAERNKLLVSMTQEVAELVLDDNYKQALIMSFANFSATQFITLHTNYIKDMETANVINRGIEFLPDEKKLAERKGAGLGLTRPELAVLLAYTKINIKAGILDSDIPDHPYLSQILDTAFPASLQKNYAAAMAKHSLHREIVATQLSNMIVNEAGISFVYNLQMETGASIAEILRSFIVASRVFGSTELRELIDSFDFKIPLATQYELIGHLRRLIYLATRWFLRHKALTDETMESIIKHFSKGVKVLEEVIPNLMGGFTRNYLDTLSTQFIEAGISTDIARRFAGNRAMYTSLNVIEVASNYHFNLTKTAEIYFAVGEYFNLLWFRDRITNDPIEGFWNTLARLTLRDELDVLQKKITVAIMQHSKATMETKEFVEHWIAENQRPMERWKKILELVHSSTNTDYTMFFVALKELAELIHTKSAEVKAKA